MNKVIEVNESIEIANKLKKQNKTIVVVGGFFDILHLGHIKFLENSKKYGDYLFVLLEDDTKAKAKKDKQRPINPQESRARVLSALQSVDYVVMLKNMTSNNLYDKLMTEIRPEIISTTYGDPYVNHKIRQAKLVQGKVVYATKRIGGYSTTKYRMLIK